MEENESLPVGEPPTEFYAEHKEIKLKLGKLEQECDQLSVKMIPRRQSSKSSSNCCSSTSSRSSLHKLTVTTSMETKPDPKSRLSSSDCDLRSPPVLKRRNGFKNIRRSGSENAIHKSTSNKRLSQQSDSGISSSDVMHKNNKHDKPSNDLDSEWTEFNTTSDLIREFDENYFFNFGFLSGIPRDCQPLYDYSDASVSGKLSHAINELLVSEKSYVGSLHKIIENYVPELGRLDVPQCLRGMGHQLFGNIEILYKLHCHEFLPTLEKTLLTTDGKTSEETLDGIGDCFLKHKSDFHAYVTYWANKPNSDRLLEEPETRKFLKGRQDQLGDKLDLSSYLLKPVQRFTKYQQLLHQLSEYSNSHEKILEAEDLIKWFLRQGNDLLAAEHIQDSPISLKTEAGRLIRQDQLYLVINNRLCARRVFLYEKLIVIAKPKSCLASSVSTDSTSSNNGATKVFHSSTVTQKNQIYIFKEALETNDFGLTQDIPGNKNRFGIWQIIKQNSLDKSRTSSDVSGSILDLANISLSTLNKRFFKKPTNRKSFIFQAEDPGTKDLWVQDIETLHWKQMSHSRERQQEKLELSGHNRGTLLDLSLTETTIQDRKMATFQSKTQSCHAKIKTRSQTLPDKNRLARTLPPKSKRLSLAEKMPPPSITPYQKTCSTSALIIGPPKMTTLSPRIEEENIPTVKLRPKKLSRDTKSETYDTDFINFCQPYETTFEPKDHQFRKYHSMIETGNRFSSTRSTVTSNSFRYLEPKIERYERNTRPFSMISVGSNGTSSSGLSSGDIFLHEALIEKLSGPSVTNV